MKLWVGMSGLDTTSLGRAASFVSLPFYFVFHPVWCSLALQVKVGYPPGGAVGYHVPSLPLYFPLLATVRRSTVWSGWKRDMDWLDEIDSILGRGLDIYRSIRRTRTYKERFQMDVSL